MKLSFRLPGARSAALVFAALGVVFPVSLIAAPSSLEERLAALEAQVASLADENADLRRQIGAVPTAADQRISPAGKESKLSVGGYLHLQAEAGGSPNARFPREDRFYLRRARLQVKGEFGSDFDFTLQTDFGSNTLSAKSGATGQLADLFVRWKKYPEAIVTMGQFKTPFGYDQLMADTKLASIERSLPSDKLTVSRQVGIGLSGAVWDGVVNYATGVYNGNKANNGFNDNDAFMYVGRLGATLYKADGRLLQVAANGYTSDDTGTFTGRRNGLGIDTQLVFGPGSLNAEYLTVDSDPLVGAPTTAAGWSLLGTWMVVPKTLEAIVRYEDYDPKDSIRGDDSTLWTVGGNYFVRGNDIKLSLNYLFGETAGEKDDRLLARLQLVY